MYIKFITFKIYLYDSPPLPSPSPSPSPSWIGGHLGLAYILDWQKQFPYRQFPYRSAKCTPCHYVLWSVKYTRIDVIDLCCHGIDVIDLCCYGGRPQLLWRWSGCYGGRPPLLWRCSGCYGNSLVAMVIVWSAKYIWEQNVSQDQHSTPTVTLM